MKPIALKPLQYCVIPNAMTSAMTAHFAAGSTEMLKHPGGHDVPRDERHVRQVVAFLLRFAKEAASE